MSLSQNYLQVPRSFIIDRLLTDNESYFNEEDKRIARIETECKGFYSYNEHVQWWRINFWENHSVAFVNPIFEQTKKMTL